MSDEQQNERRENVAGALEELASRVRDGSIRTLVVLGVTPKGEDTFTMHVEEGTSTVELLGLSRAVERMIDGGLNAQRG